MGISARDVVPLSHARATFSELAEEVKAGAEKYLADKKMTRRSPGDCSS